jgi:hypothetical protein
MNRVIWRGGLIGITSLAMGLGFANPAFAAVGNDKVSNALAISSLPYLHSEYTASATTAPTDPADCYGDQAVRSVWFKYKATRHETLTASTLDSGYLAVVSVFKGKPTASSTPVACSVGEVDLVTVRGDNYFFMVDVFVGEIGPNSHLKFQLARPPQAAGIHRAV